MQPEPSRWWRRLLRLPLLWAVVCIAIALPWYLAGNGLDLLPFLLTLAAGALASFAFVNFTFRLAKTSHGVLLHVAGAVVLGLAFTWAALGGFRVMSNLPEPLRAVTLLVTMGLIPATCWVWLALLRRAIFTRWVSPAKEKPKRIAPAWEHGTASPRVRFSAIPMTMRTLGLMITLVILVLGSLTALALIAIDVFLHIGGSRLIVVLTGSLLAVPTFLILTTALKRRTVNCTAQFDHDYLRVDTDTVHLLLPLREIDRLLWRYESDYARFEVRGGGHDISLITGIARTPPTVLAQLPRLPPDVVLRLGAAGLTEQRTRKTGLTVFRRLAPHISPPNLPGLQASSRP